MKDIGTFTDKNYFLRPIFCKVKYKIKAIDTPKMVDKIASHGFKPLPTANLTKNGQMSNITIKMSQRITDEL